MKTIVRQRIRVFPHSIETYYEAPLHLFVVKRQPPFHVVSSEFAGVLEGDHFETEIVVESGACLTLSTQEATKLMAMPSEGARHDWHIVLHADSLLAFLPNETIPFAHSDFIQEVICQMKPGASLLWGEVVIAGRLAHHEYFQFRHYHSRLSILDWDSQRPLYHENQCLKPGTIQFEDRDIWGRFTAWGSLVAIRHDSSLGGFAVPSLKYTQGPWSRPYYTPEGNEDERDGADEQSSFYYQGQSSLPGGFLWRIMTTQPQGIHHLIHQRIKEAGISLG